MLQYPNAEHTLFGLDLGSVIKREAAESCVPNIVCAAIKFIEADEEGITTPGLYRIPGSVAATTMLKVQILFHYRSE